MILSKHIEVKIKVEAKEGKVAKSVNQLLLK